MKIGFIKKNGGFFPVTNQDLEDFAKISEGKQTILDVKITRNVLLFRKYWALMRMVLENTEGFRDKEHVSHSLLIATGYCDQRVLRDGTSYVTPHHINWESCSPEKFDEIWDKIIPYVMEALKVTEQEINDNLVF
jgi:hypothetical protein